MFNLILISLITEDYIRNITSVRSKVIATHTHTQ